MTAGQIHWVRFGRQGVYTQYSELECNAQSFEWLSDKLQFVVQSDKLKHVGHVLPNLIARCTLLAQLARILATRSLES